MSSQKYHYRPPIYQIPNHPSQRLKAVLDYLDNLKRWDFDAVSKQFTSDFTLQILPASMGLSPRTKSEYIESQKSSYLAALIEWHSPRGVFPPGLSFHPRFGRASCKQTRSYIKSTRAKVKFISTYVPCPIPFSSCKRYVSRINPSQIHADERKIGQSRGHFQLQVWNWQGRTLHRQSHQVYRHQNVRWWG